MTMKMTSTGRHGRSSLRVEHVSKKKDLKTVILGDFGDGTTPFPDFV